MRCGGLLAQPWICIYIYIYICIYKYISLNIVQALRDIKNLSKIVDKSSKVLQKIIKIHHVFFLGALLGRLMANLALVGTKTL